MSFPQKTDMDVLSLCYLQAAFSSSVLQIPLDELFIAGNLFHKNSPFVLALIFTNLFLRITTQTFPSKNNLSLWLANCTHYMYSLFIMRNCLLYERLP